MTAEPFRVGLLGHGTVGSAFDALLAERADAIAAATGRRPELCGVLTRSRGSFDEILERADAIVELIGGIEPAREYALRALAGRQAGRDRQQAAALSQHGDELFAAARAGRRAASLRGGGRGGRAGDPRDARVVRRRAHREGARDRERHDQLHPHRDGAHRRELRRRARARAGARLRGGRPDRGRDRQGRGGEDGDPRAARVPRRGDISTRCPTRASRRSPPTTSTTRRSSGSC